MQQYQAVLSACVARESVSIQPRLSWAIGKYDDSAGKAATFGGKQHTSLPAVRRAEAALLGDYSFKKNTAAALASKMAAMAFDSVHENNEAGHLCGRMTD